ncbi:unnamed protein product [Phytomonas sp. EM1]|nr:unnamed protein product [Phytomonas sp. EM1]|eukprot:CCW62118.1 unnamed protein product [Phytomonas sp. isolate EM1]
MPGESYPDTRLKATLGELTPIFKKAFDVKSDGDVEWMMFTFAPGRVNLIGEHVDYMHGWVCPAAVLDGTHILVGRVKHLVDEKQPKLRFYSTIYRELFELDSINGPTTGAKGDKSWKTFIRGAMTLRLKQLGIDVGAQPLRGVCMVVHGTLPLGAGMSASAAFGVSLLQTIDACATQSYKLATKPTPGRKYAILDRKPSEELIQLAKQGRQIETDFCGVNIGIMDQFVSALAEAGKFIFLDCKDLSYSICSLEHVLGSKGEYCVMLIDSMIKHELIGESANVYNTLRSDQESAEKKITEHVFGGKKTFTFTDWVRHPEAFGSCHSQAGDLMAKAKPHLTVGEFERGSYQIQEQLRTLEFKKVADPSKTPELSHEERVRKAGALLNEAHEGMKKQLRNTTPEIDFIQEMLRHDKAVAGGRMMGGGFGGCVITLVKRSERDRVIQDVRKEFKKRFNVENKVYKVDQLGSGVFSVSLASLNSASKI